MVEVFRQVYYRRHMDISTSLKALSALAQESRLNAFRLLVRSDSEGLIASHRETRSIIHRINFNGTGELPPLLMEDCCQRQPHLCSPVLDRLLSFCCASSNTPGEQHEKNAR